MSSPVRYAPRGGMTLIEILVSVAILGLTAIVATLTMRRIPRRDPADLATILSDSLERVLSTGVASSVQLTVNGQPALATIHPDGTVVADSILLVDRLTGRSIR